jgi:hypothetical protein
VVKRRQHAQIDDGHRSSFNGAAIEGLPLMSTRGVLSSPSQRKIIATFSLVAIVCLILVITGIYKYAPQTRGWKLTSEVLVAFTSSAMFAFLSATFLHFFTDPYEMASTYLVPADIGPGSKLLQKAAQIINFMSGQVGIFGPRCYHFSKRRQPTPACTSV